MSYWIVVVFFALSLVAYVLCAGADFGVGILELFVAKDQRKSIRKLAEHAIAPIWEANHIWIIVALVILFVGFPAIHVKLSTDLHIPMILMLGGIILRGTAFTFRYYDIQPDAASERLWTWLFRIGSVLVPIMFGLMVGATATGKIQPEATDFYTTYLAPWLGLFPIATGIFVAILFAWIAAVFLVGEAADLPEERPKYVQRARTWTLLVMTWGGVVSVCAWLAKVPWLEQGLGTPWTLTCIVGSALGVGFVWRSIGQSRNWLPRIAVGVIVTAILGGYWGTVYPVALQLDHAAPPLTWTQSAAPTPVLRGLAIALVAAGLTVVPSLFYLYRLFKSRD